MSAAETSESDDPRSERELFKVGIIADIQYCLKPDQTDPNFGYVEINGVRVCDNGVDRTRSYGQSLNIWCQAIEYFDSLSRIKGKNLRCIVLGDVLDKAALNPSDPNVLQHCKSAIFDRASAYDNLNWHYLVGNNDLQCLTRTQLYELYIPKDFQELCSPTRLYYDISPQPGFRFMFLDSFDVSAVRNGPSKYTATSAENYELALQRLRTALGPCWEGKVYDYNCVDQLQRYRLYNGEISAEQLRWLEERLQFAQQAGERVFIFAHLPIHPDCCRPDGMSWNSDLVLDTIQKYSAVQAFITGHDHDGGYTVDSSGIHHIVPPAPLEALPEDTACFGHLEFFDSHFRLMWSGNGPHVLRKNDFWPKDADLQYRT
jgi:manganese-dependent ADP-ribose/CDP-alcohol diphosphatase